ncbi:hypothetical protein CRG98_037821 [Punica granatum]|uniref:Uncharacterized protein n=1 Tax=Punica granatum TaxID=22663 RepID=A0A2I0IEL2_PUNGR|nr:hypothetical protein CRG98_037821 [Punica granatum]
MMFPRLIQTHEGLIGQDQDLQVVGGGGGPSRGAGGDPCLVLTSDPKPRLRWTADLHERFVDAVTQLGGASRMLGRVSEGNFRQRYSWSEWRLSENLIANVGISSREIVGGSVVGAPD